MDRSDRSNSPESQLTLTSADEDVPTVVEAVPAVDESSDVVEGDVVVDGHDGASNPPLVVVRPAELSPPSLPNCAKKQKGDVLVETVRPHRSYPRRDARDETIEFFVALIQERGALPPEYAIECNVLADGALELIDGAHRVEAARRASLPHLPCRKVSLTEAECLRRIAILNNARNPLNLLERGRLVWADQSGQNAEGQRRSVAEWAKIWGLKVANNVYAWWYAAEVLAAEEGDVDGSFWKTRTAHLAAFYKVDRARWAELVYLCKKDEWTVAEARAAAKAGPDSVPTRKGRPIKPITPWGLPIPLVPGTRQSLRTPSGRILLELCDTGTDGVVRVRVLDPKEADRSEAGKGATPAGDGTVSAVEEVPEKVSAIPAVGSRLAGTLQKRSDAGDVDSAEPTTQGIVFRSQADLASFRTPLPKLSEALTKLFGHRAPTDPPLHGGQLDGNRDSFHFVAFTGHERFRSRLLKGKPLSDLDLQKADGDAVLPERAGTALLAVFGTKKKVTYVAIGYYDGTGKPPTQFFGAVGETVVGHAIADVRDGGEYGSLQTFAWTGPKSSS